MVLDEKWLVGAVEDELGSESFNSPLTPLQKFGADVRRVRLGRKLRQRQLGNATGYSESYVSQVESGKLLASTKFAVGCDQVFGTNGLFAELQSQMVEGDHPPQFVPYLELERKATRIMAFSASTVMGLLQTEAYAEAVFRAGNPRASDEVIGGKVAARLRRARLLGGQRPPTVWCVLFEASLRAQVGGKKVMAEQLSALLSWADGPSVDLQVLPFSLGAVAVHSDPFTLLTFRDSQPVMYANDPGGGRLFREPETVGAAVDNYDRLRANALGPDDSLDFIRAVREEYEA